jgi:hypothetical protein
MAKLAIELIYEAQDLEDAGKKAEAAEKNKKAEEVLRYADKVLPSYNVRHNYASGSLDMARAWVALGHEKEAMTIINQMWDNSVQYARWYCSLNGFRFDGSKNDALLHFYIMQQLVALTDKVNSQQAEKQMQQMTVLTSLYEQKGGQLYEE